LIQSDINVVDNMALLWQQNRGFINKMAVKFKGYGEIEDLEQEGYFGLIEAVNNYNHEQGVQFISYASHWIKQVMQRYIHNCCHSVRIPVHAHGSIIKYKQAVALFIQEQGCEPSDNDLAVHLNVILDKLGAIKKSFEISSVGSLDSTLNNVDGNVMLVDTVASNEMQEDDVVERVDTESMEKELWAAVDTLPGDSPHIINDRYKKNMSIKEMAQEKGLSVEQIRQQGH
jgi:RNA polymerase primary sigma factor